MGPHEEEPPTTRRKLTAAEVFVLFCRFRLGRQEDSHEFLRCLLDAMHESCLKPFQPKPPPDVQATTLINRIFGGKLRSRVR